VFALWDLKLTDKRQKNKVKKTEELSAKTKEHDKEKKI